MNLICIAIDDDNLSLSILEKFCKKISFIELTEAFNNPWDALVHLKNNKPDIIFLDIGMPEISGLAIAREFSNESMIIFTTSYKHYAFDGFELNITDYLLKPYGFKRFQQAVCKAREIIEYKKLKQQIINGSQEYIVVKSEYKNIKIETSEILFIEALDNYAKIHTKERSHITHQNLKYLGKKLDSHEFIRVHKSFIVAVSKIDFFSRESIHINSTNIPIGRTYLNKFKEHIKQRDIMV
ncbi:LytR/AlgR family response regulator transcription factor [Natronoflexus pectinivorans]|uniref:LytTR family two component transcriptional regulator n=1 Tax=Natronoflexus pectinivorans TaxID=682526 RepID=A0A4R2GLJ9_9BACT|nr:LytTR family DNA-binding domain-containing protein [Natronoflexus pectinivorans]TCO09813.1 LytTR family two component transcriptional regulator [Natronoflexus pectinivorans]